MITISPPEERLARGYLEARGGFAWWYLDLVDPSGNGIVLIWSYGLPFLPNYASRARDGRAEAAGQRPSLNVAVYQSGELDCYLLQEYPAGDVEWNRQEGTFRFGSTRCVSQMEGGRRKVAVDLDAPVPGSGERLRGRVEVEGVSPTIGEEGPDIGRREPGATHEWSPLAVPARGSVDLTVGDAAYQFDGAAYHDRNAGNLPLHELGIDRWIWGRLPMGDRESIFYALWPEDEGEPACFALSIDDDGAVDIQTDLELEQRDGYRTMGGLEWHRDLRVSQLGDDGHPAGSVVRLRQRDIVDSGPFYMRFITEGVADDGTPTRGFSELIRPGRIDLRRHRPLVQMRVHRLDEDENSMWLPLFTGPKKGRIKRLFRHTLEGPITDMLNT
jgi:hypothetical protein